MRTFLEQVMKVGNNHKITFVSSISREDNALHSSRGIFTSFTSWKEGMHLGGQVDSQRIFDFDLTPSERLKKLPAGYGHTLADNGTTTVVMPEV
jgi:S-DNA-T family DNA segregation ATPase FtsK/SpoIIIE